MMDVMNMQGKPQQAALLDQLIQAIDGMSRLTTFKTLPLKDMPVIGRDGIKPILFDMLEHDQQDDHWQQIACPWDKIKVPALHMGGWYDTFIGPTLADFTGLLREGSPSQKVIIGPWAHGSLDNLVGEVDFGVQASAMLIQPEETLMRWFDYWLKDVQNGIMQEPLITMFVMGDNRWRTESEWPLSRTHNTNFYLHSSGTANTLRGSGRLASKPPGGEPVDSFVYDPLNPTPTHGGGLCCWAAALSAGAYDQRKIEAYVIELGPASNVFKAGHCLRLEISSSSFPRFDRNPNTGLEPESDKDLLPALQTILHDANHPSHIVLPVVPR